MDNPVVFDGKIDLGYPVLIVQGNPVPAKSVNFVFFELSNPVLLISMYWITQYN